MTEASWQYGNIETHADDAADRLTSQYADAEKLQGLVSLWGERIQGIEDAAWSLLTKRWLDGSEGEQLDKLGGVVGERRMGRDDETYRGAIAARITINSSGGQPEAIIGFLVNIAGAESVQYQEIYPAQIEVFVDGSISQSIAQQLQSVMPAGVGPAYLVSAFGQTAWRTREEGREPSDDEGSFGELGLTNVITVDDGNEVSLEVDGAVLAATDHNDPLLPDEGGIVAELFEV